MPRVPFARVVWLTLTVLAVNVVSAFLPNPISAPRSQNAPFLVPQLVSDNLPFGEDVAVPGKGERDYWGLEQQSKHLVLPVSADDITALFTQREHVRRAAPAPVLPVRIWFPRKLSPPAAADEPFLELSFLPFSTRAGYRDCFLLNV